jgi:hypothetical protein
MAVTVAGHIWEAPPTAGKEYEMERLALALENAGNLAELLGTAWDAFDLVITASGDCADTDEGFFTALVYALAAAANGRDAITAAPSLPPRPLAGQSPGSGSYVPAGSVLEMAGRLGTLSGVLADRLTSAAGSASDPSDRAACLTGARYAREIHALLAGTQP